MFHQGSHGKRPPMGSCVLASVLLGALFGGGGRDFSREEISRKESPIGAASLVAGLCLFFWPKHKLSAVPATVATAPSLPCLPGRDELYPQTAIHTISFLLVLLAIGI